MGRSFVSYYPWDGDQIGLKFGATGYGRIEKAKHATKGKKKGSKISSGRDCDRDRAVSQGKRVSE